ncbi:hypothetical protein XELAEV_18010268mg [Xenopus laevis]|uniref:Ig-like domain-containing protein n=1 Tax=Xenopus laevis TaxID=8355 RepID=A0A974DV27_XENLA|nr:hypothetical protein XELAEV_18010268mg [Xenopus laevis]
MSQLQRCARISNRSISTVNQYGGSSNLSSRKVFNYTDYFILILYLFFLDVNCKEEVNQIPQLASKFEGSSFNMTCEYTTTFFGLQWYKQEAGEKLQLLTILRKDEEVTEDRFVFRLQKEKQLSTVSIKQVEVSDSTIYWCALQAQC